MESKIGKANTNPDRSGSLLVEVNIFSWVFHRLDIFEEKFGTSKYNELRSYFNIL